MVLPGSRSCELHIGVHYICFGHFAAVSPKQNNNSEVTVGIKRRRKKLKTGRSLFSYLFSFFRLSLIWMESSLPLPLDKICNRYSVWGKWEVKKKLILFLILGLSIWEEVLRKCTLSIDETGLCCDVCHIFIFTDWISTHNDRKIQIEKYV